MRLVSSWFSGIRRRVFVAAVVPMTLGVVSVGGLMLLQLKRLVEQHHLETAIALAKQTAILAELPLATGSKSGAKDVADFVMRSEGAVGVSLLDRSASELETRGNVGATSFRLLEGAPLDPMIERDDQLIYMLQPVTLAVTGDKPQLVGYAIISVSRAIEQQTLNRLLLTGFIILLSAFGLSVLLARWIADSMARPMASLSSALNRVAKNDFSPRLSDEEPG
jgi:methyl-accepting chemotaxis protein